MLKLVSIKRFKHCWNRKRKESAGAADLQIVCSNKILVTSITLRKGFSSLGKQISFKELAGQLKDSNTELNNACAQVKSPAVISYDSDSADLENAFAEMNTLQTTRNDEFGFKENVAGFTTSIIVSKETIPKYEEYEKTAMVADKYCIICLKSCMNLENCLSTSSISTA